MAAPENKMADTRDKPTPVQARKKDQSYPWNVESLSTYQTERQGCYRVKLEAASLLLGSLQTTPLGLGELLNNYAENILWKDILL